MNMNLEDSLTDACILGNIETIKKLIKKGVDIDPAFDNIHKTPLYWAASQNQVHVLEYLLTSQEIFHHPKAEFKEQDLISLFCCERLASLEYLIFNHHLVYNQNIISLLKNTLDTMGYSQEENVDKLDSLVNYMQSHLEKSHIEKELTKNNSSLKTKVKL